jgi:hypothetical protein
MGSEIVLCHMDSRLLIILSKHLQAFNRHTRPTRVPSAGLRFT